MKYIRDIRRYMDTWHLSMLLQYLNDTKGRAQETLDLLLVKPNSTRKYETEGHIKRAIHNLKQAEESIYKALSLYAEKRPYPRQEQWPPKKRGRKGESRTLQTIMHEAGKGKFEEVETFIKSNSEHSNQITKNGNYHQNPTKDFAITGNGFATVLYFLMLYNFFGIKHYFRRFTIGSCY